MVKSKEYTISCNRKSRNQSTKRKQALYNELSASEPLQIIDVSTNANISIIKPNTHESSYSRISKAKPRLEYNFEPIQDKTTFTIADDTLDTKNN